MNKYFISNFYCTECGNKGLSLPRQNNHKREAGHLKNLYCIHCKKTTNHVEINENNNYTYQDFIEEFQNGNFINGKRIN